MNKEFDLGCIGGMKKVKSIKLRPSRLEQVDLPSNFHTEEYKFLRESKVDASMADHLILKGQTRSRNMQDHHLAQLGGTVLPQCRVFLET